eukprot:CFRG2122T1
MNTSTMKVGHLLVAALAISMPTASMAASTIRATDTLQASESSSTISFETKASRAMLWTGFPWEMEDGKEWGNDQLIELNAGKSWSASDSKSYGHVPVLVAWDETATIVASCVDKMRKPDAAGKVSWSGDTVELTMSGCSEYRTWLLDAGTDYWDGLRQYALYMQEEHGLVSAKAPEWALKPWWSTYHYEEDFKTDDILRLVPTLFDELNIGNVQIDSGGWGTYGWGMDVTGVNSKTLGSVDDFKDLISELESSGQNTIVWGALMAQWSDQPEADELGIYSSAGYSPITGNRGDDYLLKPNSNTQAYILETVDMLKDWGVKGIKADDVSEPTSAADDDEQLAWTEINHSVAKENPDFSYMRCTCGMMQSFHNNIAGMNTITTSDFMGKQLRHRIKAINALNLGGAAIMSDYIELNSNAEADGNRNEVESKDLYENLPAGVIETVVGLGAVLQTKCSSTEATSHYNTWFQKYNDWALSDTTQTTWINHAFYEWNSDEVYEVSKGDLNVVTTFKNGEFDSIVEM